MQQVQLLPSFPPPSVPRPDCLSPTQPGQIRAPPNPRHFSSGAACTRAAFLPLGLPIHSRIHSHSLSPLPPFASPNLSYTPRSAPCHTPTDPVFNPQILPFIPRNPRNQNKSCHKQPPAARRKIKSSCQTLTQRDFRARNSFAPRSFRTLLLSLVPVSRKLISFREAFTSSRWALSLCLLAPGDSVSFSSPSATVLWCDATRRSAAHRARSAFFATGHIIVTAPATHCRQDAWGSDHPTHPSPDPHRSLQPRSTLVN